MLLLGRDILTFLDTWWRIVHAASGEGYFDVSRYLVEDCGLDINAMTSDLLTPLYLASLDVEVCKYILEKGASVDVGIQPLSAAAQVLFRR
jgi:hypothetical protein